MAYVMHPLVLEKYLDTVARFGKISTIPTPVFWHGLQIGEEIMGYRLDRIGGVFDKKRTFYFTNVKDGGKGAVNVEDPRETAAVEFSGEMCVGGEGEVGSPMPGVVIESGGNRLFKEGESMLVIEAMKMTVSVKCPADGKYENVLGVGEKVVENALVARAIKQ